MSQVEVIGRLVRRRQDAARPWAKGIVQSVSGSLASVTLDSEGTARSGIPVAVGVAVAANDYVLLARFDELNYLVLAKIPV